MQAERLKKDKYDANQAERRKPDAGQRFIVNTIVDESSFDSQGVDIDNENGFISMSGRKCHRLSGRF